MWDRDREREEVLADYYFGGQARRDNLPLNLETPPSWQQGWRDVDKDVRVRCVEPDLLEPI
jgi:hypothetical protein